MILRFIIFLIIFFAVLVIAKYLLKKELMLIRQWPIMSSELSIISGLIFLIIGPYLLSGFFDLKLYAFIFGGVQASVILSLVLISVLGTKEPKEKLLSSFGAHSFEVGINHPIIARVVMFWPLIVLIGYLIFVSYVYFTNPFGSREAIKDIMVATLLWGFLVIPTTIIPKLSALISKNIDRDTRNYLFCYSFAGIIPSLIYLSVPFLFLGVEHDKIIFAVGGVKLTTFYMLLIAFMLYFVFFTVIPHAYGMQAHKKARIADYNDITNWLDKVIEAFRHPHHTNDVIDKITNIENELEREIDHYKDENPFINVVIRIESSESQEVELPSSIADLLRVFTDFIRDAREMDRRFVYYDFLEKMRGDVLELITAYKNITDLSLLLAYSANDMSIFRDKKHKYEKEMREITKQRWVGTVTISFIFSAILGTLVGEYAISIANYLQTIIS